MRKLSLKQQRFIDTYVGEAKGNATEAALKAGYSPKTAYSIGNENLKKPEIEAGIRAILSENGERQKDMLCLTEPESVTIAVKTQYT